MPSPISNTVPKQSSNPLSVGGTALYSSPAATALYNKATSQSSTPGIETKTPASFNMKTATYTPAATTFTNQTPVSSPVSTSNPTAAQQPKIAPQTTQTVNQPAQPTAQASYSGGQALPAVGSAAYNQSASLSQGGAPNNTGNTGAYTNPQNEAQQSNSAATQVYYQQFQPNPANAGTGVSAIGTSSGGPNGAINTGVPTSTTGQTNFTAQPITNNGNGLYNTYVQNLANQGNSPYNQAAGSAINNINSTAAGNAALGQNAQQIANAAGQKISDIGNQGAMGALGYTTSGGDQAFSLGGASEIAQTTAARQQAVAQGAQTALQGNAQALTAQGQEQSGYNSAAGQALTGQGQAQSALGTAAGYAAPILSQYGQANYGIGGDSGGAANAATTGVTGNTVVDNSVSRAVQAYNNGASLNDAVSTLVGGPIAEQAFLAQISGGGTPNITTQNAVSNNNASQAAQYKQSAVDLSTGLQNLQNAGSQAQSFLQANSLLNPNGTPAVNGAISSYIAQKAPGAVAAYNSIIAEIQKFQSQIQASTAGTTPTAQTQAVLSTDPRNLSADELGPFLQTLQQSGQNQLSTLQSTLSNLGGNTGLYAGQPSTVNTQGISQPASGLNGITGAQAAETLGGAAISAAGGIEGFLSKIAGLASNLL